MLSYFISRCISSKIQKSYIEFRLTVDNFRDLSVRLHKIFGFKCFQDFTCSRYLFPSGDVMLLKYPLHEFVSMCGRYQYGFVPHIAVDSKNGRCHIKSHNYVRK